jgi:hypothetical protein
VWYLICSRDDRYIMHFLCNMLQIAVCLFSFLPLSFFDLRLLITPLAFSWSACTKSGKWAVMYVLRVLMCSLFLYFFRLDLGTTSTAWYFICFCLFSFLPLSFFDLRLLITPLVSPNHVMPKPYLTPDIFFYNNVPAHRYVVFISY